MVYANSQRLMKETKCAIPLGIAHFTKSKQMVFRNNLRDR
jgi:hypothetical protein